jgi:hypothetical protein
VKALLDVVTQYRGTNNGALTASWAAMRPRGWTSKDQLAKAVRELEECGWILRTRQGSITQPTWYAITFRGIDYCGGQLDAGVRADPKPLHLWKNPALATLNFRSRRRVQKQLVGVHRPDRNTGEGAPYRGATNGPSARVLPLDTGRKAQETAPVLPRDTGTSIDLCQADTASAGALLPRRRAMESSC